MDSFINLGIDVKSIVFYAVNFGVVFFLVHKYLVKPITKVLDERSNDIKKNIELSNSLRQELEEQKEKYLRDKKILEQELNKNLLETIERIKRKESERAADLDKMEKKILDKARIQAEEQKKRVLQDLKKDIAEIVYKSFTEITQSDIDKEKVLTSVEKNINESVKSN